MQLKQFYNIDTKVSSRKSTTTFGDLPDSCGFGVVEKPTAEIILYPNDFHQQWVVQTTSIRPYFITTNCRFYSYFSQILLMHKTWRDYNKFDFTKSLRVSYWNVKYHNAGIWSMD